jgi:WNK lysine deficient protein kinase
VGISANDSYINKNRFIRWAAVKRWCRQLLKGLAFLHQNGVIHRDIKCDNIFINGATGDIRIGDLGLSIHVAEDRSKIRGDAAGDAVSNVAMTCLGTPEFMAPELYEQTYDNKVDIYAFGMCALEMITQQIPFSDCAAAAQIYRKVFVLVQCSVVWSRVLFLSCPGDFAHTFGVSCRLVCWFLGLILVVLHRKRCRTSWSW